MPRQPPPTDEQLRMAWRHVSRPGWPPTLEQALELPLYRVCLYGIARNLGRAPFKPAPRPAPPLPLFDQLPKDTQ